MLNGRHSRQGSIAMGLLVAANAILPLAVVCFAIGFFPYKPFMPGAARFAPDHNETIAPFDKVIFMVVDALRSDFVYSSDSGFLYVQDLVRNGMAIPFTAHAASPTITMPKVKAMTTGSVPSFLDVILNFAESDTSSTLAQQDTWPSQLLRKADGKHLVMYGDDTWLKLFPGTFARSDGTSSFFVSDFTEVDNNVTRHIPRELENNDWNGMIMHYLGLDHIGHKAGPRSPHMVPKQREMDGVVRTIYEAIESKPHLASTLLMLCGDHGMNDAGNHGGSAHGETSPALVFISPKFQTISTGSACPLEVPLGSFEYYQTVQQSDIAPTLAGLLGFPVPLNNLGVFIPRMLDAWPQGPNQLRLLYQNARQMLNIVEATFPELSFWESAKPNACKEARDEGLILQCLWEESRILYDNNAAEFVTRKEALLKFLWHAQDIMSSTASNYDLSKLYCGIMGATISMICCISAVFYGQDISLSVALWALFVALGYGAMMFASSFVEEEHHFWYWIGSAWLVWLYAVSFVRKKRQRHLDAFGILLLLLAFRILRRWNQTGQKHAGERDIGRSFLPQHSTLLWLLTLTTYFYVWVALRRMWPQKPVVRVASFILCLIAFTFKVAFTNADAPELLRLVPRDVVQYLDTESLVFQARVVFAGLTVALIFVLIAAFTRTDTQSPKDLAGSLHTISSLFLVTQTRVNNIPLYLLFSLQHVAISRSDLRSDEITLTCFIFQFAAFFALGGSNAISSVDLSNAYNGIAGYNVLAVGVLTFFSNWAGPTWWALGAVPLILMRCRNHADAALELQMHVTLLTALVGISLVSVMVACTLFRAHLFIWTVFSPKYLYTMAWSLGQHLGVNIGVTSLVWWICTWRRL